MVVKGRVGGAKAAATVPCEASVGELEVSDIVSY